jgi:DNA-binding MarR family transcriptional regulator
MPESLLPLHDVSEPPLTSWRAFLRAHARVMRVLEAELQAEQQLALADYDVLVQLSEAPPDGLRMSELADSVLLSRSGLTRLVDRLVSAGYVDRRPCPDDARGRMAVLTPEGLARLRAAAPTHLRGVGEHVISRLTPQELQQLGAMMDRLG